MLWIKKELTCIKPEISASPVCTIAQCSSTPVWVCDALRCDDRFWESQSLIGHHRKQSVRQSPNTSVYSQAGSSRMHKPDSAFRNNDWERSTLLHSKWCYVLLGWARLTGNGRKVSRENRQVIGHTVWCLDAAEWIFIDHHQDLFYFSVTLEHSVSVPVRSC